MKYLFIMGPSGSGKTTLAKFIEAIKPKRYKRIVQITTRSPRENETNGEEYFFFSQEEYNKLSAAEGMIAQVKEEFLPGMYGTPISDLDSSRINIIVASIEGFLDALNKLKSEDIFHVLFIKDVIPEIKRLTRSYLDEEKYNKIILHKLNEGSKKFNMVEISHNYLKQIRDNEILVRRFLVLNKIK